MRSIGPYGDNYSGFPGSQVAREKMVLRYGAVVSSAAGSALSQKTVTLVWPPGVQV